MKQSFPHFREQSPQVVNVQFDFAPNTSETNFVRYGTCPFVSILCNEYFYEFVAKQR